MWLTRQALHRMKHALYSSQRMVWSWLCARAPPTPCWQGRAWRSTPWQATEPLERLVLKVVYCAGVMRRGGV